MKVDLPRTTDASIDQSDMITRREILVDVCQPIKT